MHTTNILEGAEHRLGELWLTLTMPIHHCLEGRSQSSQSALLLVVTSMLSLWVIRIHAPYQSAILRWGVLTRL